MSLPRWAKAADGSLVARSALRAPFAVFSLTTSSPIPTNAGTENSWRTIDLADGAHWNGSDPNIPNVKAVKAIEIYCIVIVTHNGSAGIANYEVAFRSANPDDTLSYGNYQIQAEEYEQGGGVRQNSSLLVPVYDGKFQFFWRRTVVTNFSCGINAKIYRVIY